MDTSSVIQAPGNGIFAFSTGLGVAQRTLAQFFRPKHYRDWKHEYSLRLKKKLNAPFFIIGIPSDSGGGICRGAAHGPLALRQALYRRRPELARFDLGDIPSIPNLLHDEMLSDQQLRRSGKALWGGAYRKGYPVSPLNIAEETLVSIWKKNPGAIPLVLGGDHSISWPVFSAMHRVGKTKNLAVLHFDAHTDLKEERLGVRICFGTWTAHAVPLLEQPEAWVQAGIRATGKDRTHWENRFGIQQYWAKELVRKNPRRFAETLVQRWKDLGCENLYVTFDIDGADAKEAPATGTPEPRGLKIDWMASVVRECLRDMSLVGADLAEVAPVLGSALGRRKTLSSAVRLVLSLVERAGP